MIRTMDFFRFRRRLLLRAVLFSLATSLLACGPKTNIQWTSPAHTVTPQRRVEVLIMPLGQKTQEILPSWVSENDRIFLAYFDIFMRHGFDLMTSSRVTVVEDSYRTDALQFNLECLDQDNDPEWKVFVPQSGRVQHAGRYPDFVLIFDDLDVHLFGSGGARQTYDTPGRGKVEVGLEYVLWDNQNQEIAAYGRLHEEAYTNSPYPSSQFFKDIYQKMAEEIVRNSPLSQ